MTATGVVETLRAGSSSGISAATDNLTFSAETAGVPLSFSSPTGVAVDPSGSIHVSEADSGRVRTLLADGTLVDAVQSGTLQNPGDISITQTGRLLVADANGAAREIRFAEPVILNVPAAISNVGGETLEIQGQNFAPDTIVVVGGVFASNMSVEDSRTISLTLPPLPSGLATLTVQNRGGIAQRPVFIEPVALSTLPAGHITTVVGGSTFTGDGSAATSASFYLPYGVAVDSAGNLFVADQFHHRIRKISARTGIITTVAGTGRGEFSGDDGPATAATLSAPSGVAIDTAGNLFIADNFNHRVRRVSAATGIISTVAGNGLPAFSGDNGPATEAALNGISAIAVDARSLSGIDSRIGRAVRT